MLIRSTGELRGELGIVFRHNNVYFFVLIDLRQASIFKDETIYLLSQRGLERVINIELLLGNITKQVSK